ncbi:pentapeptide repeat-containing protein [Nannocystis pusilla]|uniref:Pentapeptide repeat-containing protein n=1 Tax=Nannocystis pusilla TaxID=889268 RepID=A0A9X3J0F4_9BACT|nr:pentapeptide repeat-containing protein [Nannocystis pusilla]MCY1011622.1 pentapeptide repeat-containing protein [Nannocystis pusilla]
MRPKELARLIEATPRDRDGVVRVEGVVLDPRSAWPLRDNHRLRFERVDFGAPLFGSFWTRPTFRGCVFVDCDLDGVNATRTSFVDCAFERLSVGRRLFSAFSRCAFRACTFVDCTLASAELSECSFHDVAFTRCEIARTNFSRCALVDTTFTGALRTVNLTASAATRVDLRGCAIVDSSLLDGPELDLRLPDGPNNFVAYPRAFVAAVEALEPVLSPGNHDELRAVAAFVAGSTYGEIVDESLFARISADQRGLVLERLFALRDLRA